MPVHTRFHLIPGLILGLIIAATSPSRADEFNRGFDAYTEGDFQGAFSTWLPLAEAGDLSARFQ